MKTLDSLRKKIEKTDIKIAKLLCERLEAVKQVAFIKKKENIPIYQKEREESLLKTLQNTCKTKEKGSNFLHNIFLYIFKESRDIQEQHLKDLE